jgi:hypothetical protein
VHNTTVYLKDPFWVFNLRGKIEVAKDVKLFANVNNLFDVNEYPIFLALDETPCLSTPVSRTAAAAIRCRGAKSSSQCRCASDDAAVASVVAGGGTRDRNQPGASRADRSSRFVRPRGRAGGAGAAHRHHLRFQHRNLSIHLGSPTASPASRPIRAVRRRCWTGRWWAAGSDFRPTPWWCDVRISWW